MRHAALEDGKPTRRHLVQAGRPFLEGAEAVGDVMGVDRMDRGEVGVAGGTDVDGRIVPCGSSSPGTAPVAPPGAVRKLSVRRSPAGLFQPPPKRQTEARNDNPPP